MQEEAFSYDGYLLFHEIIDLPDKLRDENLIEQLPEYKSDSPSNGFEEVLLENYYPDSPENINIEESWISNVDSYRYIYDELEEAEAYVDGKLRKVHIPEKKYVDVYKISNRLLIRGNKPDSNRVKERIQQILPAEQLKSIQFESDFLLWLLYRHRENNGFDEIHIKRLTDAKVSGPEDHFGKFNSVSGSADLLHSPAILAGILSGKKLEMIGGDFCMDDYTIRTNLACDKIHIKTVHEIQHLSDIERIILSIRFVDILCELNDMWHDLPPEEKYPPDSFFTDIKNILDETDAILNYPVDKTIRMYKRKREKE